MPRKGAFTPGLNTKACTNIILALKTAGPMDIKTLTLKADVSDHTARRWVTGFQQAGLARVRVAPRTPGMSGTAPFLWEWLA